MFERYRELQERRASEESPEGGFTLIELLIVIIVLGILAAIVIFSLTGVTGSSQVAACNTDAKSVQVAVAAYQAQNAGANPSSMSVLVSGGYLHSAPSATTTSNGYAVTLGSGGVVNVQIGTVTTAYDSSNNCAGA